MCELKTIRDIAGLTNSASSVRDSALMIIDAQNTYTEGIMKLEGMDAALQSCKQLLDRFRKANRPIYHIQHDAGEGSPYDINDRIGQIVPLLRPNEGEPVITKHYPSAFVNTDVDAQLKGAGVNQLIIVGFMTHMCVNSTARNAFSLGYTATVVASATATRALPSTVTPEAIPAKQVQAVALAALSDLPAAVVPNVSDVPD